MTNRASASTLLLLTVLALGPAFPTHPTASTGHGSRPAAGELRAQDLPLARAPASPDRYASAIDSARSLLNTLMYVERIPGLSVAVGLDGTVLWSEGMGWADLEQRVPVTSITRFRVGSVSKPMTTAALAQLVEEGRVDLDAELQRYVPDFPRKRWPVTTRQLAGHIAGVRHYRDDEFLSSRRYETVDEGLEIFAGDTLLFEPGTDYSYSSYGWNLVSAVLEGASGEDFLSLMRRRVFEPLEMRHTVAGHTDSIVSYRTRFYALTDDGDIRNAPYVDNSYKWAGGGFLSTPEDLLRFGFAHLEPDFLEAGTLEELFTSQTLANGEETGYGIGWRVRTNDRGERIVEHGGGSVGGRTGLLVNRDRGLVVAVVANLSEAPVNPDLADRIAELFLAAAGEAASAP